MSLTSGWSKIILYYFIYNNLLPSLNLSGHRIGTAEIEDILVIILKFIITITMYLNIFIQG